MHEIDLRQPADVGVILPSKEVSTLPNLENDDHTSDLEQFAGALPDFLHNFFIVVYHHTVLEEKLSNHPQPAKGESRYDTRVPFPHLSTLLNLAVENTRLAKIYTGVMVLPQIATADAAQMLAGIANKSMGRLRLGMGAGWNEFEIDALRGSGFHHSRGMVLDQQLLILRDLLEGRTVEGRVVDRAGRTVEDYRALRINPYAQYHVPFLIGGGLKDSVEPLRRAARHDGWIPLGDPDMFRARLPILLDFLGEEGRTADGFELIGRIPLARTPKAQWVDAYLEWMWSGANKVALSTTDESSPNPNYKDHENMVFEFVQMTSWIRNFDRSKLGEVFSEYGAVGRTLTEAHPFSSTYPLKIIKLNHPTEHLRMYLAANGFRRGADIGQNAHLNVGTYTSPRVAELHTVEHWEKPSTSENAWVLKPTHASLSDETHVVYDSNMDVDQMFKRR